MGKVINEGFYTSDEQIPQPVGFITGANLRCNREEHEMGKVIDGGFSTSYDQIPQAVGPVILRGQEPWDAPGGIDPSVRDRQKAEWLAWLRRTYGDQWVDDNAAGLEVEWDHRGEGLPPEAWPKPPGQGPQ
jgi:hypothetical protein